jgi:hypothetical protein
MTQIQTVYLSSKKISVLPSVWAKSGPRLRSSNLLLIKWLLPNVRFIAGLRLVVELLRSQTNECNTNYDSDESSISGVPTQIRANVNVKYLKCCTLNRVDTEELIRGQWRTEGEGGLGDSTLPPPEIPKAPRKRAQPKPKVKTV